MKKDNGKLITLIGIIIGLLGVFSPMLWDWYNSKSNLTLVHLSTTKLVEKKASVNGLEILYNNNKINNLSKLSFKLKNSGNKAIVKDDLIDNIEVILKKGRILSSSVDKTVPSNINILFETKNNKISLSFKLLNPNDAIYFSILTDSNNLLFDANARIRNINQLLILTAEQEGIIKNDISWTAYIVGIFAILFFFVAMSMLFTELPREKEISKKLELVETKEDMKSFIDFQLNILTKKDQTYYNNLLNEHLNDFNEEILFSFKKEINTSIKGISTLPGAIISLCIFIAGSWYVITNVFIF